MSDHPKTIGKYTVEAVIGHGAMGIVYRALDPLLQRQVAIKVLHSHLADFGPEVQAVRSRFRNEAKAASRLQHAHIVMLYEYGEGNVGPYIVMEFVEGQTLDEFLRAGKPSLDTALVLMTQLLDAMQHAHDQGVVHRDIKPANLVITRQGQLKIADFGVARLDASGMTLASTTVGTPGHMSPEQYLGDSVDSRSDIFAGGVVLYQLLTLRSPFGGSNANIMYETMNSHPAAPSQVPGMNVPVEFDAVVARAMAKRPEARYASARDFKQALLAANAARSRSVEVATPRVNPIVPSPAPRSGRSEPASRKARTGFQAQSEVGRASEFGKEAEPSSFGPLLEAHAHIASWISEVELLEVSRMLAEYIGPLAKTLTRRAAARASSRDEFSSMMAEQVDNLGQRAVLLRRLTEHAMGHR